MSLRTVYQSYRYVARIGKALKISIEWISHAYCYPYYYYFNCISSFSKVEVAFTERVVLCRDLSILRDGELTVAEEYGKDLSSRTYRYIEASTILFTELYLKPSIEICQYIEAKFFSLFGAPLVHSSSSSSKDEKIQILKVSEKRKQKNTSAVNSDIQYRRKIELPIRKAPYT